MHPLNTHKKLELYHTFSHPSNTACKAGTQPVHNSIKDNPPTSMCLGARKTLDTLKKHTWTHKQAQNLHTAHYQDRSLELLDCNATHCPTKHIFVIPSYNVSQ